MAREPWQDGHRSGQSGGGFGGFIRRVFGEGDNPLSWGIPLYTAWGIRVRVHVFFVLYIVLQLLSSLAFENFGIGYIAIMMVSLFGLVLLHEYGHCFACRKVGGEADDILMWPLGGLASCAPPPGVRGEFWTVAGGPLVNVALFVPLAGLVYLLTGAWEAVAFNPLNPSSVFFYFSATSDLLYWAQYAAWTLYFTNGILLAFNVLLPMFPMDGGRLARCALWLKHGEQKSLYVAAVAGLAIAIVLGLAVLVIGGMPRMLLAIAFFGGFTCWLELRRLKMMAGEFGYGGPVYDAGPERDPGPTRAQRRAAKRAEEESAEMDRILAKISSEGMGALSRREKAFLSRQSSTGRSE
ncbi:MAG: site-2 protease family protein [Planctomycetota bacterium]